jgi:UrcA family protein
MKTIITLLSVAFVIGLPATVVQAQEAAPSVRVSYAGLDLTSTQGQAKLAARIKTAARLVCDGNEFGLASRMAVQHCREQAVAGAMTKMASLTAPTYASR